MSILYFKKADALVLRMLDKSIAEIRLPGYSKCFVVDFNDEWQVAPSPPTTLLPMAGGRGDIYLTPGYLFTFGILADAGLVKRPDYKGGSFAEMWRVWRSFLRLDSSGTLAEGLAAIKAEMAGGSLVQCASSLAAGDLDTTLAQLDAIVNGGSPAVRHAHRLMAPGHRCDNSKVSAMLQFVMAGIQSQAL